jgi:4-hydroxy-tetrahydrodipicolinate synthase
VDGEAGALGSSVRDGGGHMTKIEKPEKGEGGVKKMVERRTNWHGIFVPVITPFTKDHALDENAFRELIERLIHDGVHGIIVAGSTGEWFSLTDSERIRLFEVAKDQVKGRVTLLGGTSAIATRDTVSLTKAAKKVGMDGVLLLPPPYVLPSEREVIAGFEAVSKIGLPMMIYNNPGRTNVNITTKLAEKLSAFNTIVALKDSIKDLYQISETIRTLGDRLGIFCGLDPYTLTSLERGAIGVVAMDANVITRQFVELYNHAASGRWKETLEIQVFIDRFHAAIWKPNFAGYAGLKASLNLMGRPGGWPRPPTLPVEGDDQKELERALRELGLL